MKRTLEIKSMRLVGIFVIIFAAIDYIQFLLTEFFQSEFSLELVKLIFENNVFTWAFIAYTVCFLSFIAIGITLIMGKQLSNIPAAMLIVMGACPALVNAFSGKIGVYAVVACISYLFIGCMMMYGEKFAKLVKIGIWALFGFRFIGMSIISTVLTRLAMNYELYTTYSDLINVFYSGFYAPMFGWASTVLFTAILIYYIAKPEATEVEDEVEAENACDVEAEGESVVATEPADAEDEALETVEATEATE